MGTRSDGLSDRHLRFGLCVPFRRQGQCPCTPIVYMILSSNIRSPGHSRLHFSIYSGCFPCPPDAASESRFLKSFRKKKLFPDGSPFSCYFRFFNPFPLLLQKYPLFKQKLFEVRRHINTVPPEQDQLGKHPNYAHLKNRQDDWMSARRRGQVDARPNLSGRKLH